MLPQVKYLESQRLILMHFRLGQAADVACQERARARARDNCVMIALMCLNVCKQFTLHVNTIKPLHNTIR